jgi:ATP-dependent 26S proteasome regulatory subunit
VTVEDTDTRYGDTREHLLDELARADLLLRRYLEEWWADRDDQADEFGGLYVSDEEVDRLLRTGREADAVVGSPPGSVTTADGQERDARGSQRARGEWTERVERLRREIRAREDRSLDAGVDLRLVALETAFGLDPRERDALLLAVAPDLDRKYEKVYGYLRDDVTRTRPTVGLLSRILSRSPVERLSVMDLFAERSTLVGQRLLELVDGPTVPAHEVRVSNRVVEFLLGNDGVAAAVDDGATVVEPTEAIGDLSIGDERLRALEDLATRLGDDRTAVMAAFVGPDQRTAGAAVASVCGAAGQPLLRVDAGTLDWTHLADDLAVLLREARLQGGAVHVSGLDALEPERSAPAQDGESVERERPEDRLERLAVELDAFDGDVFLSGDVALSARLQPRLERHAFTRFAFPRPGYDRRKALWNAVDGLPADADPASLAGKFRLTRGQIEDAVSSARSVADGPLTAESILEACRTHSQHRLDELAREVEPSYDWEDIVLPADTFAHLREVAAHVRHRGTVYEEWGFEDRFSLGNGINVLFTGPSGTGKTMAAEIIARDAGLPMYKLDLSSVISKYIGETEKNLGRVFDEAEHSNAILFFDEADALFGKRTEVSDSHDRYANVEVDYLLQRMEEHDGCVILASNLQENIDDAFLRRINVSVDFPLPDRASRAAIWRGIFPGETPRADLDLDFLAGFDLSGGSIKNVALTASFMAADDGSAVEMKHVVRALRREFQKTSRLIDPEAFGEYRELLRG